MPLYKPEADGTDINAVFIYIFIFSGKCIWCDL